MLAIRLVIRLFLMLVIAFSSWNLLVPTVSSAPMATPDPAAEAARLAREIAARLVPHSSPTPVRKPAFKLAATPTAFVLTLKGAINPLSAGYLERGIDQANAEGARLIVIRLDTPGGLDQAMRTIIQKEVASRVPVVVYVWPDGARAASAGFFIAMGAHVAAMAPNTAMGAAHPVGGGGEEIKGTMAKKVENDAAAYVRGLAADHGRNALWAEKAVRQSVSFSAPEALQHHLIEAIASDLPGLLGKLEGRKIKTAFGPLTLRTKSLVVQEVQMNELERLLYAISDPNIAFILLNLGMLGMFFELSNPGLILPGVAGGICLLLAFYSLGMLPVNYAGLALILFAFLLFVADLFAPSHGVLTIGGVISLILGGFVLISSNETGIGVSRPLVLTVGLSTGALFLGCIALALTAQRRKVTTGREDVIGRVGRVKVRLAPDGQVFLGGERWTARAEAGPIEEGVEVVVKAMDGLALIVVPTSEQGKGPAPRG